MLEYMLFDQRLRDRFTVWLKEHGIEYQAEGEGEELLVMVGEDLDEDTQEQIDAYYDELLDETARRADAEDEAGRAAHRVGIQFRRADGSIGMVRVAPDFANRLYGCLDEVELQAFVQSVVDAVECRDDRPLCKA